MTSKERMLGERFILLTVALAVYFFPACTAGDIEFITQPTGQATIFGHDVFLHCSAINVSTGSGLGLQTQWWFNDGPRDQRTSIFTNGTLLIPKFKQEDIGNYTCVIYNGNEVITSRPALVFHAFINMFEVSPIDVFAIEGSMVSFDCITGSSAPPPLIFWERNDEPFYGGEQFNATYGGYQADSLVKQFSMRLILRARPSLDGNYKCVARNPALQIDVGSIEVLLRTAELDTPPYVMGDLVAKKVVTPFNHSMIIDCPITGKPQVAFTWYKNGIKIDGNPDFLVLQNGSLHNARTQLGDAGVYNCEGTNSLGLATSPNITVLIAKLEIDFVESPQDLFTIAGLPAILRCSPPISVPVANVTWYKDNSLLVPRSGDRSVQIVQTSNGYWNIHFEEIQKQDEGEYFCVGTNKHAIPQSRTSQIARLRVGGAPIFVEPPTGLTIEKGKLAKMICYVQGDPFPEVTWLFEDTILEVSESVSFRQGKQELWIGDIHKGYEGTYTCRAVNRYGAIDTRVYVKVLVPPVILEPVGHRTVSVGDTVIIPCQVYSDPASEITWYKDSAGITMGGRLTQLQDGLYITSVRQEDSGRYLCRATNMAGIVESEGSLAIQVLPHFVVKPQSQTVTIGENVTLTCVAAGYPTVETSWLFNGTSLFPQDTLLSLDRKTLFLMEVTWLHVGEYTCSAANIEGSATSSAMIQLQIPPKVNAVEGIPLLYQGENLLLKCLLTGIPTPTVEWQQNRQPMKPSMDGRITLPDRTTLSVKYITLTDAGVYTCKATNAAGVSQRDVQVYVLSRPSPPVLYKVETVSANSIALSWSAEQAQPQTPVNNFLIYYRKRLESASQMLRIELDSSLRQYEVDGLDPASEYIFMLAATNDAGTSIVSNILSAKTYDAGPSEPRNFQMLKVQARSVTVLWEIPAVTNGQMRKYRLVYRERDSTQDFAVKLSTNGSASQSHMISGLQPYTWYSMEVQGATMEADQVLWGNWSQTLTVKTGQTAPTSSPQEVVAVALSHDVIMVSWEAVPQSKQNGPIKRYYIYYWLLSNRSYPLGEKISESLDLKVNISDLEPWTWYVVTVNSENEGGLGIPSEEFFVRTKPTAPSEEPLNVTATAITDTSILVSWLPPPESDWNSELSGYIINYWEENDLNMSTVVSLDLEATSYTISDLEPWTMYDLQVAAFTDQVTNGTGPYSSNVSVRTLQSEPGIISDLTYVATSTTFKLSWEQPSIANGIVTEYLVEYRLIGPTVETSQKKQPIISDYFTDIFNDSAIMENIFQNFRDEMTLINLQSLTELCDVVLANQSLKEDVSNRTDFNQSESLLQHYNVTETLIDWLRSSDGSLLSLCEYLESSARQIIERYEDENEIYPVLNMTTSETSAVLTSLLPEHIYNISVSAATLAGYGHSVYVLATTLKSGAVPVTTKRPPTVTPRPTTQGLSVVEEQKGDDSELDFPVIIGGGVAGLGLILLILLVIVCVFLRKRRSNTDEKTRVIKQDSTEDLPGADIYGELDRPRYPNTAMAAEDGTDTDSRLSGNVQLYNDNVRYNPRSKGSVNSFMTSESGVPLPVRNGRRTGEAIGGVYTIGMENPSYGAQGTVKSNPAYFEDPTSSDLESMSVTMALSSEDMYSQGESTLKRKSKMRSVDAAAIARLRSSTSPLGMSEDTSSLINNEVEVVLNERTAL